MIDKEYYRNGHLFYRRSKPNFLKKIITAIINYLNTQTKRLRARRKKQ